MLIEIMKEFSFEASHMLPHHPGKCRRLHGHSWKLRVYVKGVISKETGFVMDYGDIKKSVQPIVDELDHKHLGMWSNHTECFAGVTEINLPVDNMVLGLPLNFYPSSENLIVWIANNLSYLPWSRLELDETCTSRCILIREEYEKING
jgi:6-pyruvoyltetrahydropterin/6-carboxytetrahydropterin synthase